MEIIGRKKSETVRKQDRRAAAGSLEVWGCSISHYHSERRTSGPFLTTTILSPLCAESFGAKHWMQASGRYGLTQNRCSFNVCFALLNSSSFIRVVMPIMGLVGPTFNMMISSSDKEFSLFTVSSSILPYFFHLDSCSRPVFVFAGEARFVGKGPPSATHHQRSSGNPVSRIPQPDVHGEPWVAGGRASLCTHLALMSWKTFIIT